MIALTDLQGHWRRAWLKAPGVVDHDTSVHWMQVGAVYADIRIPAGRPEIRGAGALADLGNATLLKLLKAEGFAGEITLDADICTWHRQINWHGAPEAVDAGRMRLDAWSELVEHGVHAEYSELWHRGGDSPAFARRFGDEPRAGFLVSVGNRFVFGIGPRQLGEPGAARTALESGKRTRALEAMFEGGFVFGRWKGDVGEACLATNPLWEGQTVLKLDKHAVEICLSDFHGEPVEARFDLLPAAEAAA